MDIKIKDEYEIVKHLPVARFYYRGNHSHPVRRTILVIESNNKWIKGYELRNGHNICDFVDSPIKTYSRNKIARIKNLRKESKEINKKKLNHSTLVRKGLMDLIKSGI